LDGKFRVCADRINRKLEGGKSRVIDRDAFWIEKINGLSVYFIVFKKFVHLNRKADSEPGTTKGSGDLVICVFQPYRGLQKRLKGINND